MNLHVFHWSWGCRARDIGNLGFVSRCSRRLSIFFYNYPLYTWNAYFCTSSLHRMTVLLWILPRWEAKKTLSGWFQCVHACEYHQNCSYHIHSTRCAHASMHCYFDEMFVFVACNNRLVPRKECKNILLIPMRNFIYYFSSIRTTVVALCPDLRIRRSIWSARVFFSLFCHS